MAKRGPKKKLSNTDENGVKFRPGISMGKYVDNCKGCELMLGEKDKVCPRCGVLIM